MGNEPVGSLAGTIELRNASCAYSADGAPVLSELDLRIEAGEMVGFVGPTGAGKSTLVRLLTGLIRPSAGEILFDGRPLSSLNLYELRSRMGVVLQESFLFEGTVAENIRFGHDDATIDDVDEAAALACIDDVIAALPRGYETNIGPRGAILSGGQRQRLCLARALVGRPRILILDEATSALDEDTERRIQSALASLRCTRIVIAHRFATLRDANRIFLLRSGRIVQEGSYSDLMHAFGAFRDLTGGPAGS